jgi:small nuclear ribonucleoprotein (snRNP)-like protein
MLPLDSPPPPASPSSESVSTRSETSTGARSARGALALLLRRGLRVSIADGRVFLGTFVGTDAQLNLLLVSAHEFRPGAPALTPEYPNGRFVGQIMLPWRHVRKVEAEGKVEDELDGLYT